MKGGRAAGAAGAAGAPGAPGAPRETEALWAYADARGGADGDVGAGGRADARAGSRSPGRIAQGAIARAAALLREGRLVAFPTETVYGLGADALDPAAVAAVYDAKGRPNDNPLILHVYDESQVAPLVACVPPLAQKLMRAFWPGPLTILFRKRPDLPAFVTSGLGTVAIRCPAHPVAAALLKAAGIPVAAPSANRSGKPSPTCAEHVAADLGGRIDAILDGGPATLGLESTVVDATGPMAVVLRPGCVTREDIAEALGEGFVAPAGAKGDAGGADGGGDSSASRPLSPGQKYRHYAPDVPMLLLDGDPRLVAHRVAMVVKAAETAFGADLLEDGGAAAALRGIGSIAALATGETLALVHAHLGDRALRTSFLAPLGGIGMRAEDGLRAGPGADADGACAGAAPSEAEFGLYAALRGFDERHVGLILCERPRGGGVAEALRDRLDRAAGMRVVDVGRVREILFVCTGNTCRSSMAEALFNLRAGRSEGGAAPGGAPGAIRASSAGIAALDGEGASANAMKAVRGFGGDLAAHRARRLAEPMVERADLALTMTRTQRDAIIMRWPSYRHKVFCMTDFAVPLSDSEGITDPFSCGIDVYEECARSIRAAIDGVFSALRP